MLEDFRLKIFLTVAQTGNFTRSSKLLNISQPAVSQNVAELEKLLDTQLFIRERGLITLTDQGQEFRKYAEKILYWYKVTDNIFGEKARLASAQTLRISAPDEVAGYILPKILSPLRATNPDLQIVFTNESDSDIQIKTVPEFQEGSGVLLTTMQACVVASTYNKTSYEHISSIEDLLLLPIALWYPYEKSLGLDVRSSISIKSKSVSFLKNMVGLSPELLAIVPLVSVQSELRDRILNQVYIPEELSMSVVMTTSEAYSQTRLYKLFLQCMNSML